MKKIRDGENLIDIIGILTDFFGTGKSNKDIGEDDKEQREWEQKNKRILDIAEIEIEAYEDMVRIPDRKGKGTSTRKKRKGIKGIEVETPTGILQTEKEENPEMSKNSEQIERSND